MYMYMHIAFVQSKLSIPPKSQCFMTTIQNAMRKRFIVCLSPQWERERDTKSGKNNGGVTQCPFVCPVWSKLVKRRPIGLEWIQMVYWHRAGTICSDLWRLWEIYLGDYGSTRKPTTCCLMGLVSYPPNQPLGLLLVGNHYMSVVTRELLLQRGSSLCGHRRMPGQICWSCYLGFTKTQIQYWADTAGN